MTLSSNIRRLFQPQQESQRDNSSPPSYQSVQSESSSRRVTHEQKSEYPDAEIDSSAAKTHDPLKARTQHGPFDYQSSELIAQRPSNWTRIKPEKGPLRGSWKVDTSIEVPASVLERIPVGASGKRANLMLHCEVGDVDADIDLVGGTSRAILVVAGHEQTRVRLFNSGNVPLQLRAMGSNIWAYIPRLYTGIITAHAKDGKIHFSQAIVESGIRLFQLQGSQVQYFIPEDSRKSKVGNDEVSNHIMLEATKIWIDAKTSNYTYGEVYLSYIDE